MRPPRRSILRRGRARREWFSSIRFPRRRESSVRGATLLLRGRRDFFRLAPEKVIRFLESTARFPAPAKGAGAIRHAAKRLETRCAIRDSRRGVCRGYPGAG